MKKLGLDKVSRSTVVNILREHGLETGPRRGDSTWTAFVKRHAATLWACDFFTKKVWTSSGLVDYFVLFFIHIGTRRVHLAGMTANPDHECVAAQTRAIAKMFAELPQKPTMVIRNCDGKFGSEFDDAFNASGIKTKAVGPRIPNMNAYAERWVLSAKSECLDHFIVFGEDHLRLLCEQYVAYYNSQRPHQGVDNTLLGEKNSPIPAGSPATVECQEILGGLLKHYHHKQAA